jgi:glycosyltransferase involved in cell wall biosynthesis
MPEVFSCVESLIVKDGAVFGFGWIFHEQQEIAALRLRLRLTKDDTSSVEHVAATMGKSREDVQGKFVGQARALHSGFVVLGAFPVAAQIDAIVLECSLADGSIVEIPVASSSLIRFSSSAEGEKNKLMLRQFGVFLKRGVRLIRAGKLSSLVEKAGRYLKGRPRTALRGPVDLVAIFQEDERENLSVIVDHDLGGGANHYRNRLVDAIIEEGRSAIVMTYHVPTLSHMLIVRNKRVHLRYSIPDRQLFLEAVKQLSVSEIVYNTAVSFIKPDEIPQLLISLKALTGARLKILAHDFFLVCPSHFLLDYEGKYCHIPEASVCAKCLPRNQQGFATLFVERDIRKWRAIWGSLLAAADEIVAFSSNTAQLLIKAYPQLDRARVSITPHKVEHLASGPVRVRNTSPLCIGVVGHIGFHKGAAFVQALAREIKDRDANLKIVVIGSLEARCEPSVVSQTGAYQHHELAGMIEASGANVMLFPSICPETFSYVVHELIDLQLPVASFNFGAPAERLACYPNGLVLASMDPARVLDQLISFHCKIYLSP